MQETLSIKLKNARQECQLSQNDVAGELNISRQAVSRWENGKAYPDIDNLVLLCKLYHVSLDDLLETKQDVSADTNTNIFDNVNIFTNSDLPFHDLNFVIKILSGLLIALVPIVMFHG